MISFDLLGWIAISLFVAGLLLVFIAGAPFGSAWQGSLRAKLLQLCGLALLVEALLILPLLALHPSERGIRPLTAGQSALVALVVVLLVAVPAAALWRAKVLRTRTPALAATQAAPRRLRRAPALAITAAVLVPTALLVYNYQLCACGSRTLTAERRIRSAIRRVVEAQHTFFADSLRLAGSLEGLALEPDPFVRLSLELLDSTGFRVIGESVRPSGVTCTEVASLSTTASDPIACTGRAPGPLGF